VPLRVPFRGMVHRAGVLVEGPAGWGEFAPLPGSNEVEIRGWVAAVREAAFDGWPAPRRDRVPVNMTIPAVPAAQAWRMVRESAGGESTAKVKVAEPGQDDRADVERVEAVRDALGPAGRLRIDVNGAWTPEHAVRMITTLARFDLEYVEQPCAGLDDMAAVRRRVDVPIAADESIRKVGDPERVRAAGAADVAVLKVGPLGGVRAALDVAERCGLQVVVSSALETSIGLAAGVALAAALPELRYACGLGTAPLLAADLTGRPLLPAGGWLDVRRPEVDEGLLAAHPAPADEAAAALAALSADLRA
jgi:O-succinylbenzoate synthase